MDPRPPPRQGVAPRSLSQDERGLGTSSEHPSASSAPVPPREDRAQGTEREPLNTEEDPSRVPSASAPPQNAREQAGGGWHTNPSGSPLPREQAEEEQGRQRAPSGLSSEEQALEEQRKALLEQAEAELEGGGGLEDTTELTGGTPLQPPDNGGRGGKGGKGGRQSTALTHSLSGVFAASRRFRNLAGRNSKLVRASTDVLQSYSSTFLFGEVPLFIQVRSLLSTGWTSVFIRLVELLAAMVGVVLWVLTAGRFNQGLVNATLDPWVWIETPVSVTFAVLFCLRLYSAPVRLAYVFSYKGALDIISCLTVLTFIKMSYFGYLCRVVYIMQLLRPMVELQEYGLQVSALFQQIMILMYFLLSFIFLAAAVFLWAVYLNTSLALEYNCDANGCLNYGGAIYFLIVTISTVGYGDITPHNSVGRLVVIGIITVALFSVPVKLQGILDLMRRRPYGGNFRSGRVVGLRKVVLCGQISQRSVAATLAEMFHPIHDNDLAAYPLQVVILSPVPPSFEMETLVAEYGGQVRYIQGSPMSLADLDRIRAADASAVFVLHEQMAKSGAIEQDKAQVVQALSMSRYMGSSGRVIVEMFRPGSDTLAVWDEGRGAVQVVCSELLRFQILASSCFVTGLSTLIINLLRAPLLVAHKQPGHWMLEYHSGMLHHVYPLLLPRAFHGMTFQALADFLYNGFFVCLFGLDIPTPAQGAPQDGALGAYDQAEGTEDAPDTDSAGGPGGVWEFGGTPGAGGEAGKEEGGARARSIVVLPVDHVIDCRTDVGLVLARGVHVLKEVCRFATAAPPQAHYHPSPAQHQGAPPGVPHGHSGATPGTHYHPPSAQHQGPSSAGQRAHPGPQHTAWQQGASQGGQHSHPGAHHQALHIPGHGKEGRGGGRAQEGPSASRRWGAPRAYQLFHGSGDHYSKDTPKFLTHHAALALLQSTRDRWRSAAGVPRPAPGGVPGGIPGGVPPPGVPQAGAPSASPAGDAAQGQSFGVPTESLRAASGVTADSWLPRGESVVLPPGRDSVYVSGGEGRGSVSGGGGREESGEQSGEMSGEERGEWRSGGELSMGGEGRADVASDVSSIFSRLPSSHPLGSSRHWEGMKALRHRLEAALQWPPEVALGGTPPEHPPPDAVLDAQRERIMRHLEERTKEDCSYFRGHVVVCVGATWPTNLFYLLTNLTRAAANYRRPAFSLDAPPPQPLPPPTNSSPLNDPLQPPGAQAQEITPPPHSHSHPPKEGGESGGDKHSGDGTAKGGCTEGVRVVILSPGEPDHVQWGRVGFFPGVFLVRGDPRMGLGLARAGVVTAAKVLVLSSEVLGDVLDGESTVDVDSASIASRVQALREACGTAPTSRDIDSHVYSLETHSNPSNPPFQAQNQDRDQDENEGYEGEPYPPPEGYASHEDADAPTGPQRDPFSSVPGSADTSYATHQSNSHPSAVSATAAAHHTPFNATADATANTYARAASRGRNSGRNGGTDTERGREGDSGTGTEMGREGEGGWEGDRDGDWAPERESQMPLLVEVQREKSLQYFRPMYTLQKERANRKTYVRNREGAFAFAPVFQCGKVLAASSLSAITCASFYNKRAQEIVCQLITGRPALPGCLDMDVLGVQLLHIPGRFKGQTYGAMFSALLRTKLWLPLGLYRAQGTQGSIAPFVHTNPVPWTRIGPHDLVYVLRLAQP